MDYPNTVRIPFLNPFTEKCHIHASSHSANKGGGRHHYLIRCGDVKSEDKSENRLGEYETQINFQEGALTTVSFNGIFSVALLAVLIDHLKSFQEGEFSTREAAVAITKLEEAQHWLCARADERQSRGVLGAHAK